jgi:membrane fusion protein (multidrug efflux system)
MKKQIALSLVALVMACPAFAQGKGKGGQGPTPVVVAEAYTDQFVDRVEAIGTLKANESITVASTVTETVTSIHFNDGQRVAKGDLLVAMASGEETALLEQQKALVNEAAKQLERTKELAKNGAAATSVLDERRREYASAKAGMDALQSRLEDHIITAPFDGVLGLRNVSVGALLQPGTAITTLDDDSVMKLDFSVPSVFLPTLKPGLGIVAKASGFPQEFKGEVTAVDSQVDEVTRSITVRAILPNPESVLKPGLLMTVELLKDPRQSVGIPENAIVPEGRKAFVFVVDETKTPPTVEKREVTIGVRREGDLEVVKNLKAGEKVVVQGTMMVRPGAPVKITAVQQKGETEEQLLKRMGAAKSEETKKKDK